MPISQLIWPYINKQLFQNWGNVSPVLNINYRGYHGRGTKGTVFLKTKIDQEMKIGETLNTLLVPPNPLFCPFKPKS